MITQAASPTAIASCIACEIVERHLDDFVARRIGQKELGEAIVADLDRKAGMAVIAALDADDLPALGGMAGALQRDVDRLGAAGGEDRVLEPFRALVAPASRPACVRMIEGKWWLPMSKWSMPSRTAATTSGLRWPRE